MNWGTPQTVTVNADTDTDTTDDTATLTHTAAGGGYAGRTASLPVTVTDAGDVTAPSLDGDTPPSVNGNTLTLTYDEALDTGSVPGSDAFAVTVNGNGANLASGNPVAIAGSAVTLTLASAVTAADTVMVSYTAPSGAGANPIRDASANQNVAPDLSGRPVTNVTPGILLSRTALTVAEGGSGTYTVRLNTRPSGEVTVTITSDIAEVTVDDTSADPGVQNTLTFTTLNWSTARTVTVRAATDTDTDDDSATLTHTAAGGGYAGLTAGLAVTVADAGDVTAPTLADTDPATVNGASLVLTYDEALDTASVPGSDAFAVTVNGNGANLAGGNPVAIAGSAVTLTLASAVTAADTVTVSYTAPSGAGANPIRDASANHNAAAGLSNQPVTNVTPGILLSRTALTVAEGGSGTYTVRLNTQPTGEVTVTVARESGGSEDVSFDTSVDSGVQNTLTFTTLNWSTARTVTVRAATDTDTDDDSATLTHTGAGGGYAGLTAGLAVTVTDAGDTTAPSLDGDTPPSVNGNTLTLTYDEALDTASVPGRDAFAVTVNGNGANLAAGNPVAITGSAVTLTLANAVTAADTVTVSYTAPTGMDATPIRDASANHNAAADLSSRPVTNVTPGILLSRTALTVAEGGSGTYTVRLNTQPTGEVRVTVARLPGGSDEVTFDTSTDSGVQNTLTFTTVNWSTARTVTVRAATDTDTDDDSATLTHAAAGGGYGGRTADLPVTVTDAGDVTAPSLDGDTPPAINGATLTLTYNEALDTASVPGRDAFTVTVNGNGANLASGNPVAIAGSAVTLTLASAVTAADTVTVSYTAPTGMDATPIRDASANRNAAAGLSNQPVTNVTPGILLSRTALTVAEGGSADYTVRLNTQPTGNVTVTVARAAGGSHEVTFDTDESAGTQTTPLTFTTVNWGTPQTVTVLAATDTDTANDAATLTHTAAGGGYAGLTAALAVTVTDAGDTTAPALADTNPATVNGASLVLTYNEALDTASVPGRDAFAVTVNGNGANLAGGNPVAIAGSAVTLTLASAVTAADTVAVSYTAPSGAGANPIRDASANNAADLSGQAVTNVTPGILLSTTALTVAEGGSGSYTVRLNTQPTGEVTVTVARESGGSEDVSFDTSVDSGVQNTLTFTTVNWSTARTVTVRAATDTDTDDDSATLTHTGAGGGYAGLTAGLAVTVTDAGDTTAPSLDGDTPPSVNGNTLTLTYDEALDTASVPGRDAFAVTVNGNGANLAAGNPVAITGSAVTLTLASAVTAADTVTVSYTAPTGMDATPIRDAAENNAPDLSGQAVTNVTPGILLSRTALTVAEGGSADYTVRLNTQPTGDVTVTVARESGSSDEVTFDTSANTGTQTTPLTFTTVNWGTPQTVTVNAATDTDTTDDSATLTHTAAGGGYAGRTASLPVTVSDAGDVTPAAIALSPEVLSLAEGASSGYTVRLTSRPDSTVTVTVVRSGDEDVTFDTSPATGVQTALTFTTTNWNEPQTVTVSAATDADSDSDRATLTHTASGGGYAGLSASLIVDVGDGQDGTPPTLRNALSTDGIEVVLIYDERLDRVSVPAAGDFIVKVDGAPVALAATDPVAIFVNNDVRLRLASPVGPQATVTVSYTAGSRPIRDPAGNVAANLRDRRVDNRAPGVLLSVSALTLVEGGLARYTVRLAARPSDSVTVAITSSNAEVTVDDTGGTPPNTLTFTTDDWSTAQTVTVRAAEDDDEAADSATLTHEIGGASEYDRLADPPLAVTVNDNDSANSAPEFPANTAERSFDENAAPGTDIGAPLAATDADASDTLTYSLGGMDAGSFDIVSSSGQLRTKSGVTYDFETESSYTVTVEVSDETDSDTVTVTITLNDVNEPPAFTTETTAFEVAENTTAVGSAGAADPDADDPTVTYVLGGTDAALFSISSAGVIAFDTAPDFETPGCGPGTDSNTCTLTVTASAGADTRAMSTPVRTITVTVTDVGPPAKPAAPTFGDTTSTTLVVNWLAPASPGSDITDYDVQYRQGTTGGWTAHTHDGAALTTTLTGLTPGASYQVQVRATNGEDTSGWSDPGTGTATDNNAPAFDADSYAFELEENADGGTHAVDVGVVSATDPDGHTVSYEIAGGDDGGVFAIASDGAITYTGGGENHETTPSFSLTVRARDTENGSADVVATVSVTDLNEPPAFDTEGLTVDAAGTVLFSAAEDAATVGTLTAADPDATDTVVTYALGGTDAGLFRIADSGVITFQARPDFNNPRCGDSSDSNECTFSVTASAGVGERAMSATRDVEVTVTASNDMTAPALSTETAPSVNGATLTLTYDEALDRRSVPEAGAFTVEVDGIAVGLATGSPVAVSGSAVTLALASGVAAGQVVTLDYRPPATNPIQDPVGNDAVRLDDQPVTNVTPGIVLSPRTLTLAEGASAEYTVRLNTQPSGDVTVSIASDNEDVTIDDTDSVNDGVQNALTFTTMNWSAAQTVTVRAVEDDDTEADAATLSHTASGGGYASYAADLALTVTDAGDITAPALSTENPPSVNGATLTLTYDEPLDTDSVPARSAFTVAADDSEVGLVSGNAAVAIDGSAVTLTLASAVTPGATVTLDYRAPTGTGAKPIRDASPNHNNAADLSGQAVINATPGLLLSVTSLDLDEGGSGTYTVALAAEPSGDVTVAITSDNDDVTIDDTDGVTDGVQNTLTFTTANWSTAQTVTVRAAEDEDDNGVDDSATLTHELGGAAEYDAASDPTLPVTVTDNDKPDTTPPALVDANPATVDGATLTLTYNEALDEGSVPAADAFDGVK